MHSYVYELIGARIPRKLEGKYRKDGDHYLALNLYSGNIVSLNNISSQVFVCCDGNNTIEDIINTMKNRYPEVDGEIIRNDALKCIKDLELYALITLVA